MADAFQEAKGFEVLIVYLANQQVHKDINNYPVRHLVKRETGVN